MARRQQTYGRGLPRLALSLFVTLAMVFGICPTTGIAEEIMTEPEDESVAEVKNKGNEAANQKSDGEEPALQAQGNEDPYPLWVGGVQVTSDKMSGQGWSFNATSNTLTLDGANITNGHATTDGGQQGTNVFCGIYYAGKGPLTIAVTSNSTVDVSGQSADATAGIFSERSDLTITGAGKLTAKGVSDGISGLDNVTIDKGVVGATGSNGAITARQGDVVIINGSAVEADGSINGKTVTINSGTVKADGEGSVISGDSVTISGGEVIAIASKGNGIDANGKNGEPGRVTITGGIVSATGGAEGFGIYTKECSDPPAPGAVKIDSGIASVVASGGKRAIEGTVTNAVAGAGWTDVEGTTGKNAIAASEAGQTLSFKKVQFPAPVAKVTKAPTATNPTYNGKAQSLVTAGTVEGGTMQYSLNGDTWSDKVPTAIEVGTYTVWYKAVGDAQHFDSEPQSVASTIVKDVIKLTARGHVQNVGDVAGRASGKGIAVGTEGRGLRLEQFSLALPKDADGGLEYRGHLQNSGWGGWVEGGKACGSKGKGLRVEAVQMRLSGKLSDTHSVWYRAHVQNMGWLGWARDGQAAGTAGQGLRLESIEAQVLPRGEVPVGYAEGQASYVGAVGGSAHVQNAGWAGARSALEFGTTGQGRRLEAIRLSAPATPVPAGVSYEAHVQNVGWQGARTAGQLAGTTGQSKRLEAVRISLTGEAAAEGNYSVWYRVHSQDYGWLGWAHDGAEAGTTGLGRRAEAIDVQVLPQGQVPRGYDASRAACVSR